MNDIKDFIFIAGAAGVGFIAAAIAANYGRSRNIPVLRDAA